MSEQGGPHDKPRLGLETIATRTTPDGVPVHMRIKSFLVERGGRALDEILHKNVDLFVDEVLTPESVKAQRAKEAKAREDRAREEQKNYNDAKELVSEAIAAMTFAQTAGPITSPHASKNHVGSASFYFDTFDRAQRNKSPKDNRHILSVDCSSAADSIRFFEAMLAINARMKDPENKELSGNPYLADDNTVVRVVINPPSVPKKKGVQTAKHRKDLH